MRYVRTLRARQGRRARPLNRRNLELLRFLLPVILLTRLRHRRCQCISLYVARTIKWITSISRAAAAEVRCRQQHHLHRSQKEGKSHPTPHLQCAQAPRVRDEIRSKHLTVHRH